MAVSFGEKVRLCFPQFGEAKIYIFRPKRLFDQMLMPAFVPPNRSAKVQKIQGIRAGIGGGVSGPNADVKEKARPW